MGWAQLKFSRTPPGVTRGHGSQPSFIYAKSLSSRSKFLPAGSLSNGMHAVRWHSSLVGCGGILSAAMISGRWNVRQILMGVDWLISDTLVFVCTQTSSP